MDSKESVVLQHYNADHMNTLKKFQLPEDQERFTSMPLEYENVDCGQYRIVILNRGEPVGFFILDSSEKVASYTSNDSAMLLTSLLIDYQSQGKGFAKQALNRLGEFIRNEYPDCNGIVLSVNHKNVHARRLYEKTGFQDTGKTIGGPEGEQSIMKLVI
ncbi:GNAT family N-acetyltransferase [Salinicoccus cyprini]|uniref:GNAT family N-acetyltransferase n=1 Tax=Salinicoccus cyprini TaxID=2493691 RepID=A0A558AYR1_9STAP|nr:GNAT family N-acetyltransferase [Salinicoccus cyprini]TVT29393.1 GNAT family N-acetyltransferase [Salinicoccus cyprini]